MNQDLKTSMNEIIKAVNDVFSLLEIISKEKLEEFCRKNYIIKWSLFGSALRDELRPDSDIDVLVEFKKGHIPGMLDLAGMEIELSEKAGRKVELKTPSELSHYFRDDVVSKARVEYAG